MWSHGIAKYQKTSNKTLFKGLNDQQEKRNLIVLTFLPFPESTLYKILNKKLDYFKLKYSHFDDKWLKADVLELQFLPFDVNLNLSIAVFISFGKLNWSWLVLITLNFSSLLFDNRFSNSASVFLDGRF